MTIIVVTHEADIAAYADRVITMRDGRIISDQRVAKPAAAARLSAPRAAPQNGGHRFGAASAFGMMIVTAAIQALRRNRMRSALTMLGVFIGVAALIGMWRSGRVPTRRYASRSKVLEPICLSCCPVPRRPAACGPASASASTITVTDAEAIRHQDPAVGNVSYLTRGLGQVHYGNQNWTTSVQGVSPDYPPMTNWQAQIGRLLTADDEARSALVALIGQTVYAQFFLSGENPVGAIILVKGTPLRVIGLLASKGQTACGQDQDDIVMMPFSTAERRVLGVASPTAQQPPLNWVYPPWPNPYGLQLRVTGYVNQLCAQAVSPTEVDDAMRQVTQTLMLLHRVKPGAIQDFSVHNLSQ